jgi:carbamoyl-phosphate synthase small subunit
MKAILALEDGTYFIGKAFGAQGEAFGEVVFNTSMTGYQEILTDPSYKGQIVTMTCTQIGNYGLNKQDMESSNPHVEGFVVREKSNIYSNWRAEESLADFLKRHYIIAIEDIDTRALTKHIRSKGAMKGVLSTIDLNTESLVAKAKKSPGLIGRDLVKEVTCKKPYEFISDSTLSAILYPLKKVVVYDCGVKLNILRKLAENGCRVFVVSASTTAQEVLSLKPDGVLLSNGPGDPQAVSYLIEEVKKLIGKIPIFGICLGHQILGLALGGKTFKLKFGHRGANQPVMDLTTKKVEITCQNHGFAVEVESLKNQEVFLTHVNLNDKTSEGMRHKNLPVFSVQYHPEASAGPHDSAYLFNRFVDLMKN